MSDQNSIALHGEPVAPNEFHKYARSNLAAKVDDVFVVKDDVYRYRDSPEKAAFTDHGGSLSTDRSDDVQVNDAMLMVAKSRGWETLSVKGSPAFTEDVHKRMDSMLIEPAPEQATDLSDVVRSKVQGDANRQLIMEKLAERQLALQL